jgi:uncharacterized membrane protein
MGGLRVVGVVLLVLGILAMAYGGFSYTKDTTEAKIGPIELQVKEKKHVNVPLWAGVVVAGLGVILLVQRKS